MKRRGNKKRLIQCFAVLATIAMILSLFANQGESIKAIGNISNLDGFQTISCYA